VGVGVDADPCCGSCAESGKELEDSAPGAAGEVNGCRGGGVGFVVVSSLAVYIR
jgi:hypothetical protein